MHAYDTKKLKSLVDVLLFEITLKFGTSSRIISDNGAILVSEAVKMVCVRTEEIIAFISRAPTNRWSS
ncbi:hypothetical protein BDB01DRAFT_853808 [Pilobolus umbonatus]|nr:hypothetical protein BDB01DRAFT_853808 [Pilobolus umbonatus]